jgi:DNA-binding MarR family transcriptional regulator
VYGTSGPERFLSALVQGTDSADTGLEKYIVADASASMYPPSVDALDLIMLGRQLARIGERAIHGSPEGAGNDLGLSAGALLVMRDVFAHPGSAIADITARTGLPQSYVSDSIARLRANGMAETSSDPADGRRTLVSLASSQLRRVADHSARSADEELIAALGGIDADFAGRVLAVLSDIAARLRPQSARALSPDEIADRCC